MKTAAIIVCLLGTVLCSPVFKRDVPYQAGDGIQLVADFSREDLHTETHLYRSSELQSAEQSNASESASSQENASEKMTSVEDDDGDDVSEDKTSESVEMTTSEDKTSEEVTGHSQDKSDSDEDGDTRDDSRGSEEITRKRFYRIFRVNLDSMEESSSLENTVESQSPSQEDTEEVPDSTSKATEPETEESHSEEGGVSDVESCQQGGDVSRSCESESFEDVGDDTQKQGSDLPTLEQNELQLRR